MVDFHGKCRYIYISHGPDGHSNGTSPCSIGNTSSQGPFSIAMGVYRSVVYNGSISMSFEVVSLRNTGQILLMEEIPNNHLGCIKPCK